MRDTLLKPSAMVRKSANLLTQYLIITAARLVGYDLLDRRNDLVRLPLADIKQSLKKRNCFPLC
jgi:hypothetical protein